MRRSWSTLVVGAALAVAVAPSARAACEVPLPGEPPTDEEDCGPLHTDPPPTPPPGARPKVVAWASGFDLNPFNADRLGIYIAQTDGTRRRKLTSFSNSLQRDFSRLHGLNLPDDHPSFSPDSRKIAFTSNRANSSNFDIYLMNVNGSGVKRLTQSLALDTEPVFSPDGTKIAFATARFGNLDIAVMNASDGGNVQRLTTNAMEDIEPAWRPDGQEVVFSRVLGSGEKDIFVIKPDGTGERRVTFTPKEDHDATYSPNGEQLAITSERNFSPPYGNVHKIRVSDGADLGDLTADQELGSGDPFWSRDGTLIAYFNAVLPILRGPQQLFVMGANGQGKFRIPGEAQANIHPAIGLATDDDRDGTPNYLESGSVGKTALRPHRIRAGRTAIVRFDWTHPRRWKRLDTLWLRVSQRRWLRSMVRFSVAERSFSLFDGETDTYGRARRPGRGRLRSSLVTLDLRRTRVVEVNRRKLRLVLALRFPRRLAGERFRLRAQANDSRGRNQEDELGGLRLVR